MRVAVARSLLSSVYSPDCGKVCSRKFEGRFRRSASNMPLTKLVPYRLRPVYSGEPTPPLQGAPGSGVCGPFR